MVLTPAIQPFEVALLPLLKMSPAQLMTANPGDPAIDEAISGPLLSALFHVLAGSEEASSDERDAHDRFPASASRLFAAGYDDLPFVDLWRQILIKTIEERLGARFCKVPCFSIDATHDVDAPFRFHFQSFWKWGRSLAGNIARGELGAMFSSAAGWITAKAKTGRPDPFDHFDWMMTQAEKNGSRCTFYVIAGHSDRRLDGDYDIRHPLMMSLWDSILKRGHRMGVHPSYNSYRSLDVLTREHERMILLLRDLGLSVEALPVRMHYLRFDPKVTPRLLDKAGFKYDSTLGFADRSGFRRGTSRPFRLWDFANDRALQIEERPLIAMDATLLRKDYEALDREGVANRMARLAQGCAHGGGSMTILWHNNYFSQPWHFQAYRSILELGKTSRPGGEDLTS
jgi:hypothetical protein